MAEVTDPTETETPTPPTPTPEPEKKEAPETWNEIKQQLKDLATRLLNLEVTSENQAPTVTIPVPPKPQPKNEEDEEEQTTQQEAPKSKTFLERLW